MARATAGKAQIRRRLDIRRRASAWRSSLGDQALAIKSWRSSLGDQTLAIKPWRSIRPLLGVGRRSPIGRWWAGGIKRARVVLPQRKAHEHADGGGQRHRDQ